MLIDNTMSKPSRDSVRLATFLDKCRMFGSLKGFKHFEVLQRGREEVLLSVYDPKHINHQQAENTKSKRLIESMSPLDKDFEKYQDRTVFLIAGYARYRCPYVWLRSHHALLAQEQDDEIVNTDNPLRLETTVAWKTKEVALWEIVQEIISMTVDPCPENPFEISMEIFDSLDAEQSIMLSASLLVFLKELWLQSEPDVPFVNQVFKDINTLEKRHFSILHSYTSKPSRPII
ncbi:hypothetical protein J3Q64DRAFT_1200265 [Phycomyces blakesleeanus]|uniref:DUF7886 domain-containing protein n=1 Tax=Phycomyces blakesleeanus TaxID=4837 RepID=A0ABR3ATY3_PHYBL